MTAREMATLTEELEVLKRLLAKTQEPRSRQVLYQRAWQLMSRLRQAA